MQQLIELSKIFSDINRLKILTLLLRENELCVCEVCDTLNLSQPLVSRNLKQMHKASILTSEKKGKWVVYSLTNSPDTLLECWTKELSKKVSSLPALVGCALNKKRFQT